MCHACDPVSRCFSSIPVVFLTDPLVTLKRTMKFDSVCSSWQIWLFVEPTNLYPRTRFICRLLRSLRCRLLSHRHLQPVSSSSLRSKLDQGKAVYLHRLRLLSALRSCGWPLIVSRHPHRLLIMMFRLRRSSPSSKDLPFHRSLFQYQRRKRRLFQSRNRRE